MASKQQIANAIRIAGLIPVWNEADENSVVTLDTNLRKFINTDLLETLHTQLGEDGAIGDRPSDNGGFMYFFAAQLLYLMAGMGIDSRGASLSLESYSIGGSNTDRTPFKDMLDLMNRRASHLIWMGKRHGTYTLARKVFR